MARSRNIKPGFFVNDELAEIDPLGRLLFIGLWTLADREGRLEDRPKKIKAEILPFDNCEIDQLLQALADYEFIVRYVVGGKKYIQVINFKKHQNPHMKEAASVIPPIPDLHQKSTVQTPCNSDADKVQEPCTLSAPEVNAEETQFDQSAESARDDSKIAVPRKAADEYGASTVQAPDQYSSFPADSLNLIPDSLIADSRNPHPDIRIPDSRGIARERAHAREPDSVSDSRFNAFWKIYPKKVGKGAAEKAYKRICPTEELQEQMLAAVSCALQSRQWQENNGQYIPNPATWLNQRRWEDDLSSSVGSSPVQNPQVSMAQEAIEVIMHGAE